VAFDPPEVGHGAEELSVKDVAAAGGWRNEQTLFTSYQQVDAETVRQVVLNPTHRIVSEPQKANSQQNTQHGVR